MLYGVSCHLCDVVVHIEVLFGSYMVPIPVVVVVNRLVVNRLMMDWCVMDGLMAALVVQQRHRFSDRGLLAGHRSSLRDLCRYRLSHLLLDWLLHLFAESVGNQLLLGHLLVLVFTCGVIRVFGEVAIT